jgi:hypothetical protein
MTSAKKYFPGTGKFDKINSTFRSKIYFNSTQKVPTLDGYSKGLLQQKEPDDKIAMLESWIVRLYNSGYLRSDKTLKIEFYVKSFLDNKDELFLILEPLQFRIVHDKYIMNERLNKFLMRFYTHVKSGNPVTKELVDSRIRIEEDEIFSVAKKRFENVEELTAWCIQKVKEGFPEGIVKGFHYKYYEKYFSF